ncbi:hypothetical protein BJV85_001423 [Clostridium acetobutylicum]|uniref:Lipoprotein n=1 Tax=Clostridium acetobutylicum (strain ATCC 824 / DSM 792 / JCM 1419 / IAM 19013 / LMG 5710 / NBRC 13948 / NRRL B-527 / VKM B-1787 / 2291 / W) TaxID=272562 RepID=Q97GA7_CLOAB|nr:MULTISPECIES: hypothetical protein [Clostridium]AAK80416.1 Hypothetical protein, CF-13 family [Clostridium acetobutylicum ATCC 824]ADZ21513.1 conserved hypothetical protein [Clostridium acetobutylicum EA 2018]AEI32358.1 hypothetical protein SMB_G2497 [Clostridium acetobutylicum DSM 1731]AWV79166.1 hypothetical protein DK921_03435 [Clostridium acetobutylicum]MBC2394870.1 hypothetical protein [Clostridium acetobutylicum]
MKKRRILSALLIVSIVAVLGGCVKPGVSKEQVQNYLKKKYKKEFVVDGYYHSSKKVDRLKMIAHPKGNPEDKFLVEKYNYDTKSVYEDNYASRVYSHMVDDKIKATVGNDFPNFKYASYISLYECTKENYINPIDYDKFVEDQGKISTINISVIVNYGDDFNKNTEAQQIYAFMKKIIDNKLVKSPMQVEASFYFVDSKNFAKANAKECAYNDSKSALGQDYSKNDINIYSKYNIDHDCNLESEDGINYNQDIRDIINKL